MAAGLRSVARRRGPLSLRSFGHTLSYLLQSGSIATPMPRTVQEWADVFDVDGQALVKWRHAVEQHNRSLATTAPNASLGGHGELLQWSVGNLDVVVSPFVELRNTHLGVEFVARRRIQPGAFLVSVPTDAIMVSNAPPLPPTEDQSSGTRVLEAYVVAVEDLAAQLLSALTGDPAEEPLRPYGTFLRQQAPPRNLPYLRAHQLREPNGTAAYLRAVFEEEFKRPMCPALQGVDDANLRWAVSVVLSRRVGTNLLVPIVDFFNHSHAANCFYSAPQLAFTAGGDEQPEEKILTATNVLDNLFAGVPEDSLCRPYLHAFAIAEITPGTPINLSYSDEDPTTDAGKDSWMTQWGFVPKRPSEATAKELADAALVVARHTVLARKTLFPKDSSDGLSLAGEHPQNRLT